MTAQNSDLPKRHRAWLRSLPGETGQPLSRIASEAGLAKTTLLRPLEPDDDGTSVLSGRTIQKVVDRWGVPPPSASRMQQIPSGRLALAEDAVAFKTEDAGLESAVRSLIGDRKNTDPWTIRTRSLELVGVLPGDIVLVELGATPNNGDAVCAQTEIDVARHTATTVMRIYERVGSNDILAAATLDPTLRKMIPVDERVLVRGVIVAVIRAGRIGGSGLR